MPTRPTLWAIALLTVLLVTGEAFGQAPTGPSSADPAAEFSLREPDTARALMKQAQQELAEARRLVAHMREQLEAKSGRLINPRELGTASLANEHALQAATRLRYLAEPAWQNLAQQSADISKQLEEIRKQLIAISGYERKIAPQLDQLHKSSLVQRRKIDAAGKLADAGRWEAADSAMQSVRDALRIFGPWVTPPARIRSLSRFESVDREVRSGYERRLRTNTDQQLAALRQQGMPPLDTYMMSIDESVQAVGKMGTAQLGGKTYTGPQLVEAIERLWRETQQRIVRQRGIDWYRECAEPKVASQRMQLERDYQQFVETTEKAIVRLVESEAERATPVQAGKLYVQYVAALAPLLADPNLAGLREDVEPELTKLLGKSPELQAQAQVYQAVTGDVLRWRQRIAEAQAEQRIAEDPPLSSFYRKAFGPNANGSAGLLPEGSTSGPPRLLGVAEPIVRTASDAIVAQQVTVTDLFGYGSVESLHESTPFDGVTETRLKGTVDLEAPLQSLRHDLLVDEDHGPLTLAAAIALASAKSGTLVDAGGKITALQIVSLPARCLDPDTSLRLPLGPLPQVREPGDAFLVQLLLEPQWLRHRYFFVSELASEPARVQPNPLRKN